MILKAPLCILWGAKSATGGIVALRQTSEEAAHGSFSYIEESQAHPTRRCILYKLEVTTLDEASDNAGSEGLDCQILLHKARRKTLLLLPSVRTTNLTTRNGSRFLTEGLDQYLKGSSSSSSLSSISPYSLQRVCAEISEPRHLTSITCKLWLMVMWISHQCHFKKNAACPFRSGSDTILCVGVKDCALHYMLLHTEHS